MHEAAKGGALGAAPARRLWSGMAQAVIGAASAAAKGGMRAAASAGAKHAARRLLVILPRRPLRPLIELVPKRLSAAGPAGVVVGCLGDVALELAFQGPAIARGEVDWNELGRRIGVSLAAGLTGAAAAAAVASACAACPVLLEAVAVGAAGAGAAYLMERVLTAWLVRPAR